MLPRAWDVPGSSVGRAEVLLEEQRSENKQTCGVGWGRVREGQQ